MTKKPKFNLIYKVNKGLISFSIVVHLRIIKIIQFQIIKVEEIRNSKDKSKDSLIVRV